MIVEIIRIYGPSAGTAFSQGCLHAIAGPCAAPSKGAGTVRGRFRVKEGAEEPRPEEKRVKCTY